MNVSRIVLIAIFCLALTVIAGCGDDAVAPEEEPEEVLDRPPIPEPTYYSGPVPEKSIELVVRTVRLSNYVASADSIYPVSGWCCHGCDFECHFYGTNPGPNRIRLVESDTTITHWDSLMTDVYYDYGGEGPMGINPLSSAPYLQHKRYWVRLGIIERYSGSTSTTTTRSTTRGIERNSAQEFGMSIGMEASVSGGLFVEFSMTLRTEFSYSSSTSLTVSEEETVEESFTIACPDNMNIVYCVWQLVDEFRIIGADGELFTDPNYQFTPGTHVAIVPAPEFVPMTTYFDNP